MNNYRPFSILYFIAKILEKLALSQVSYYLNSHNLCNICQSAYRPGHSTETALMKVVNDLFLSHSKGEISVFIIQHSYADDLQLQMSDPPDRISELLHSMQSCISGVKSRATANMLKLNDSKTELILVTSKRFKHLHNLPTSIPIGNAQIPFKQSVKNWVLHWTVILL